MDNNENRYSADTDIGGQNGNIRDMGTDEKRAHTDIYGISDSPREDSGEERGAPRFEPSCKYETVLYGIYKSKTLYDTLKVCSAAIVVLTICVFLFNTVNLILGADYISALRIALITAVPFVCVSIARKLINAKRPYEVLTFYETPPKSKQGSSFPSRHVFSSFVIGVALIPYNPLHAAIIIIFGAVLAVLRVLLGIHYVKDVTAGALIGILSGALGLLITSFIL